MTIYPFKIPLPFFPHELTGYGLMMMVAFLMGGWLVTLELRRRRLSEDYSADMVAAAVIGGVIGAKLWYVALTRDPGALFARGGFVWYGGFIGGTRGRDPQRLAAAGAAPLDHAARRARRWRPPMRWAGSAASWSTTTTAGRAACRGR